MKFFKILTFSAGLALVIFGFTKNIVIGNGLFCWWVMALMITLLGSDEKFYQHNLERAKTKGEIASFTFIGYTKVVNIDYFKLGCEKAFEWTYVTVLWVTGLHNMFYGLGWSSKIDVMYHIANTANALAGLSWCLPALMYYFYRQRWFSTVNETTGV
jgi:hypothetical protein